MHHIFPSSESGHLLWFLYSDYFPLLSYWKVELQPGCVSNLVGEEDGDNIPTRLINDFYQCPSINGGVFHLNSYRLMVAVSLLQFFHSRQREQWKSTPSAFWLLNRICLKTTQKVRAAPRLMSQSSSSLFKPTQWLQVRPSGDHSLELLLFYMGYYWPCTSTC